MKKILIPIVILAFLSTVFASCLRPISPVIGASENTSGKDGQISQTKPEEVLPDNTEAITEKIIKEKIKKIASRDSLIRVTNENFNEKKDDIMDYALCSTREEIQNVYNLTHIMLGFQLSIQKLRWNVDFFMYLRANLNILNDSIRFWNREFPIEYFYKLYDDVLAVVYKVFDSEENDYYLTLLFKRTGSGEANPWSWYFTGRFFYETDRNCTEDAEKMEVGDSVRNFGEASAILSKSFCFDSSYPIYLVFDETVPENIVSVIEPEPMYVERGTNVAFVKTDNGFIKVTASLNEDESDIIITDIKRFDKSATFTEIFDTDFIPN
ncbi:MAG: hypothetical protein IKS28_03165 [Clostridia bacterium]|nr:hypothetical protein [Clostridia bacterium]